MRLHFSAHLMDIALMSHLGGDIPLGKAICIRLAYTPPPPSPHPQKGATSNEIENGGPLSLKIHQMEVGKVQDQCDHGLGIS